MKTYSRGYFLFSIASATVALLDRFSTLAVAVQNPPAPAPPPRAYHKHAPTEPLPSTLDPSELQDNRNAFVIYTLVAEIKEILYQVPCYCGCDQQQGHESLLDCFITKHGVKCTICQKEALFCYLERKTKTPAEIRDVMASGKPQVDLQKYVDDFYQQARSR